MMIYRNMLPRADFAQSIQRAKVDHEVDTMGEYFPRSLYLADKKAFEARGCSYAAAAPPTIITKPSRPCSSRRTVRVTGPLGVRRATVRVGPRLRRGSGRGRRVLVGTRGAPR